MQVIKTKSYEYEISEKDIIINGNHDRFVLQILVTKNFESSTLYICSDIENGNIVEVEVGLDDFVILSKNGNIICKEKGERPKPKKTELDLNIDHSKTINTISEKIKNSGKRIAIIFKKVFLFGIVVGAIFLGTSYLIYINKENNYIYGKWKLVGVSNNSNYKRVDFLAYFEIDKDSNVYWRIDQNSNEKIDTDEIVHNSYRKIGKNNLLINNNKWKYTITSIYGNKLELQTIDASGNITVHTFLRVDN